MWTDFFLKCVVSSEIGISVQNLCSQHAILSSTVKTPDVYYVHFFTAPHILLYNPLHCLWSRESRKKSIKSFITCVTFSMKWVENSMLNQLLFHPLCYWVSPLEIKNQKQVLNVCYLFAGLSTTRNWCGNQKTCKNMYTCFGLFPNYYLFNATMA